MIFRYAFFHVKGAFSLNWGNCKRQRRYYITVFTSSEVITMSSKLIFMCKRAPFKTSEIKTEIIDSTKFCSSFVIDVTQMIYISVVLDLNFF